jgi:filamentous hemagglutinin
LISATGNITAGTSNFFIGNGSQLTGITVAAGTSIINGTSNIAIGASGNANVGIAGTSNVVVWATTGQYVTGESSASGNITGGNVLTGGLISATSTITSAANVTGGNVLTGGLISATSTITSAANITGGNILTAGLISATANVTGGNILTGGLISATGNITGGNLQGTIGDILNVNSTNLTVTNILAPSAGNVVNIGAGGNNNLVVSNVLVQVQNVPLSVTGNVTGGNILTAGLISATSTITSAANITGGNILTAGLISVTGNITGGNIMGGANVNATTHTGTTVSVTANITGGNILTGGLVSATANITGGNLLTAGLISATGTITSAGNLSLTGNIVDAGEMWVNTSSNGNINLNPNGTGNVNVPAGVLSVTGNITGGNISATGNITGNTGGFAIGYRDIPQVSLSSNVTTALTDAGKHYYSTSASNLALTIANNTSVVWPVGTAISIVNRGTANITIAGDTGVSLYLAGNATAGNRTVTTYGMATAMNVAANVWMINGTVV